MGCGTSFTKYVLFFFNLFLSLIGLAIVGLGVAVLMNWSPITKILRDHLSVAPWFFIIIGAATFIIAFCGCCGAIRESHCMVVTYAIFLLIISIALVTIAALMLNNSDSFRNALSQGTEKLYSDSKVDSVSKELFNTIELQFECCGNKGAFDYGVTMPDSCCSRGGDTISKVLGQCTIASANQRGCNTVLTDTYSKYDKPIAGGFIVVACIGILGALFALCLANSIRNMDRRSHY